ncbi:MAG: Hpt domain-containing protein [Gemmatimonadetes bacterium]|nr:Hpt domain-containing protein [Gemmatimonadota bacterium]
MDDIVKEFLVESSEGLDQLDRNLVALEQAPGETRPCSASIFRCIHTIKGTSGFLGLGSSRRDPRGQSLLSDLATARRC